MTNAQEFAVRVEFRRDEDGRCHIGSPDLIGLHLAGHDMDVLRKELDTIIKDLVWFNLGRVIDRLRWVPSLEEIAEKYKAAQAKEDHAEFCVMYLEAA
jgi:hypothetical protein